MAVISIRAARSLAHGWVKLQDHLPPPPLLHPQDSRSVRPRGPRSGLAPAGDKGSQLNAAKRWSRAPLEDLLVAVRAAGSRPRLLASSQGLWEPEVPVWGLRSPCPEHSPPPLGPLPAFPDPTRQRSAGLDLAPSCGWQDLRVYRAQPGWPCQGARDRESPRSYLLHATPAVAVVAGLGLPIVVWEMFRNQPFNENKRN